MYIEMCAQLLGARYAEFKKLIMLSSENWKDNFDALLHLVKEFIVAVWEVRK